MSSMKAVSESEEEEEEETNDDPEGQQQSKQTTVEDSTTSLKVYEQAPEATSYSESALRDWRADRGHSETPLLADPINLSTLSLPGVVETGANVDPQVFGSAQYNFVCNDPNCSFWQRANQLATELVCAQTSALNVAKWAGQPAASDCCALRLAGSECPYISGGCDPLSPSPPGDPPALNHGFLLSNRSVSPLNQPLHLATPRISFARRNSSAANFPVPQRAASSTAAGGSRQQPAFMHSTSSVALDASGQHEEARTLPSSIRQPSGSGTQSRKSSVTFAAEESVNKSKALRLAIGLARNVTSSEPSEVAISVTDLSAHEKPKSPEMVDKRRRSSQDDRSNSLSSGSHSSGSLVSIEPESEPKHQDSVEPEKSAGVGVTEASEGGASPRTPTPPSYCSCESRSASSRLTRVLITNPMSRPIQADGVPRRSPSMHSSSGARWATQKAGPTSGFYSDQERPKRHHSVNERPQQLSVLSPPSAAFHHHHHHNNNNHHHHHHQASSSLAQSPTGSLPCGQQRARLASSGSHSPSPRFNFGR